MGSVIFFGLIWGGIALMLLATFVSFCADSMDCAFPKTYKRIQQQEFQHDMAARIFKLGLILLVFGLSGVPFVS